jgi:hypothetical protein
MSSRFSHPSYTGRLAAADRADERTSVLIIPGVDWRAVRQAKRSCCCPARPSVIVIVPAAPGRNRPVDLLLCTHHFRASESTLAAAGYTVVDTHGWPIEVRLSGAGRD